MHILYNVDSTINLQTPPFHIEFPGTLDNSLLCQHKAMVKSGRLHIAFPTIRIHSYYKKLDKTSIPKFIIPFLIAVHDLYIKIQHT